MQAFHNNNCETSVLASDDALVFILLQKRGKNENFGYILQVGENAGSVTASFRSWNSDAPMRSVRLQHFTK